eukprot:120245_1
MQAIRLSRSARVTRSLAARALKGKGLHHPLFRTQVATGWYPLHSRRQPNTTLNYRGDDLVEPTFEQETRYGDVHKYSYAEYYDHHMKEWWGQIMDEDKGNRLGTAWTDVRVVTDWKAKSWFEEGSWMFKVWMTFWIGANCFAFMIPVEYYHWDVKMPFDLYMREQSPNDEMLHFPPALRDYMVHEMASDFYFGKTSRGLASIENTPEDDYDHNQWVKY